MQREDRVTHGLRGTYPATALTLDFLEWLASGPRTYAEVTEAWRTSCPRLSIWEDALADGLVRVERSSGSTPRQSLAVLTDRGRHVLNAAKRETVAQGHESGGMLRSVGIRADPDISSAESKGWLMHNGNPR